VNFTSKARKAVELNDNNRYINIKISELVFFPQGPLHITPNMENAGCNSIPE